MVRKYGTIWLENGSMVVRNPSIERKKTIRGEVMIHTQQSPEERASAIAERDRISPIPCTRRDTGELIWLVQSRSDPSRHYLLTVNEETIQCPCPQAQHRGVCAHAVAVRQALQAKPQPAQVNTLPDQPISPPTPRRSPRSESQREQERRQRAEAERRERAILWTDDRPFSIWK
jgi:hypothetical protein